MATTLTNYGSVTAMRSTIKPSAFAAPRLARSWIDVCKTVLAVPSSSPLLTSYLNRKFSFPSSRTLLHPISFIPRTISVCSRPSARSTPGWPAAARG